MKKKINVLIVLDVAPDYREQFLRQLGEECQLTVCAHPCYKDQLTPPSQRKGYKYIEFTKEYGNKLRWNNELKNIVPAVQPDVICMNLNFRYPLRLADFLRARKNKIPWIWWGPVFGSHRLFDPFKKMLIRLADGALVYTDEIASKLQRANAIGFNNSQHSVQQFHKFPNHIQDRLHCLFVGRPQPRKRLELLLDLAEQRSDVDFRLVGPGMDTYFGARSIPANIELCRAAHGQELAEHFRWSNLVLNPGHAGLLVMNAAAHNRAIAIDNTVDHAPEVILAKEANQYFLNFENVDEISRWIDDICNQPEELHQKSEAMQAIAAEKYSVEHMVKKHIEQFKTVLELKRAT